MTTKRGAATRVDAARQREVESASEKIRRYAYEWPVAVAELGEGRARAAFKRIRRTLLNLGVKDVVDEYPDGTSVVEGLHPEAVVGDERDLVPPGERVHEACALVRRSGDGTTTWRVCRTGRVFKLDASGFYLERGRRVTSKISRSKH